MYVYEFKFKLNLIRHPQNLHNQSACINEEVDGGRRGGGRGGEATEAKGRTIREIDGRTYLDTSPYIFLSWTREGRVGGGGGSRSLPSLFVLLCSW